MEEALKKENFSLRITEDMNEALTKASKRLRKSKGAIMRQCIRNYIEQFKKEETNNQ